MKTRSEFLERLYSTRIENCFNPYLEVCRSFDRPDAVQIRRQNLEAILDAAEDANEIDLWVGRDLGYRGGRRTGLALADEHSLEVFRLRAGAQNLRKSTIGPAVKERTATVICEALGMVDVPVLTWNVFPFHPFSPGNPFSNRLHNVAEFQVGYELLEFICRYFRVRNAIGIGVDAYSSLAELFPRAIQARHPSYGGQAEFLRKIRETYSGQGKLGYHQGELQL